jgi:hypothetical protein
MTKIIPEEKAKQGRSGRHVLMVLVAALLLAMAAWAAVEIWGEQIDTPAIEEPGGVSQ